MSKTKKLNFAVLKSMFGSYWVGKIAKEPDGKSIFSTIDNLDELEATEEEDVEELRPEMERWII